MVDIASLVSEFLGTFMLVLAVGCNVLAGDKTWAVTSIACTLMVSIYALGGVSGANFNPAVSAALCFAGKMPTGKCLAYMVTQIFAGFCAAALYMSLLSGETSVGPAPGHEWWHAALAEVLYTFMLCFVVLNVAASEAHAGKSQFYGLAIGFVVVAGGYGAGSISGGCFNPAVALGIDAKNIVTKTGVSYVAYELLGALLASVMFRLVRPGDYNKRELTGLFSAVLAEFLGTYMLVLTVGLNVLGGSPAAAFSIAAALMSMIFALGSVSGAHFNPAVTVAVCAGGRPGAPSFGDAFAYVLAQLAGALGASLTYASMYDGKTFPLGPGESYNASQAYGAEFFYTFLLAFVVLSVATVRQDLQLSEYFGLAIGSCVTAGGFAIGAVSGGSLNPAVSFGIALSSTLENGSLSHLLPYVGVELAAGYVAALCFQLTHPNEDYGEEKALGESMRVEGERRFAAA